MKTKAKISIAKIVIPILTILTLVLILIVAIYAFKWFYVKRTTSYVEKNFPEVIENDLTTFLPFENMIGMPLSELKETVEESDTWREDTSMWSDMGFNNLDLYLSSGFNLDTSRIVYTFSNRDLNIKGNNFEGSFFSDLADAVGGLINLGSVAEEQATYFYVITDDSSKQKITDVFMCITNTQATALEMDNSISDSLIEGEYFKYEGSVIGRQYMGSISELSNYDCQAIYEYYYEYSHVSQFPACIGYLQHFYIDDTLMLRIYSGREYN